MNESICQNILGGVGSSSPWIKQCTSKYLYNLYTYQVHLQISPGLIHHPWATNNVHGERTLWIDTTETQKKGSTVVMGAAAYRTKSPALVIFKKRNYAIGPRVRASIRVPDNVSMQT